MAYLGLSRQELERQFNPRVAVPDSDAKLAGRAQRSAEARGRLGGDLDVRYGTGPKATLDIFPSPRSGAPVHIYFHGGYWRAGDKSEISFMAEPLVAAGATVILANYDLCPEVGLDSIVAQARRAIAWTYRNIAARGGDPETITLSGSSAGAHLAAMALAHDWPADGLPGDIIKGAVLVTGVYDAEPARHISLNQSLRLDAEAARRNSPIHALPRRPLPLVLAVGGAETEQWIRMSQDYAGRCRDSGIACELMEVAGEDHFTMTLLLGDEGGVLVKAILGQLGLVPEDSGLDR